MIFTPHESTTTMVGNHSLGQEVTLAHSHQTLPTAKCSNNSDPDLTADETGARPPTINEYSKDGFPAIQRVQTRTNLEMSLIQESLLVFTTCSAQLITQATLGQALVPLHIIGASFGDLSQGDSSWFVAAFSLTVGTFILASGRLGDMFGYKLMLMIGWTWLSIWSLIAGCTVYTGSQIFFDLCRSMQGLACSILLPNSLAIMGTTYPPGKRKAWVFSLFGATAPSGFIIGGVFSSLFAQLAWWPWAFWVLAIFGTGMIALAYFVIPGPKQLDSGSSTPGPQTFDWSGFVTGISGLILFNVAWNQAPNAGWSSPECIVLLVMGVLLFAAFVYVECKVAQPLVPMDGLGLKVVLVLACIMFGWASFGIWLYYWYQFSQLIQGNSPLNSVLQCVPCAICGFIAGALVAFLIGRVKSSWIMMGAMFAFCIGNVLFATNEPGRLYWKEVFWSFVIAPFGMDMSFPAATLILSDAAPKRNQGMVASLVTTVVNYSIAFGLGIAGTVETHVNNGGQDTLKGYRGAWYAGIGLSGLGILCAAYFVMSDYVEEARDKNFLEKYDREKQIESASLEPS